MLKELNMSSGKGIGGTTVDKAFSEMIQKKLTGPVFTTLKNENPVVYLDLHKALEEAKKNVTDEESGVCEISINYSAINDILKRRFDSSISKQITDIIVDENLQIDYAAVKDLFKSTTDAVLNTVENALMFEGADEVSMILLVGGLANCEIIEGAIRDRFKTKRVIIPVDASSSVLQGAVLYGHKPEVICNRKTKYTYGVEILIPFEKYIHDPSRKVKQGKQEFCDKVFDIIVTRGQSVPCGTYLSRRYTTYPKKHETCLLVYASDRHRPEYTDEGQCRKIGTVNIFHPNLSQRIIDVHFLFGGTDLKVIAFDTESRQEFETTVVVD